MANFKCLETTITNKNCIHEKLGIDSIPGRLATILFRDFDDDQNTLLPPISIILTSFFRFYLRSEADTK